MHPEAFSLGPLTIRWYGVMAALGFIAAVLIVQLRRRYADMTSEKVSDLSLYGMIAGVLGARAFYVVQFWSEFKDRPLEIIRIDHGGLVFYGGFICALGAIYWFCRRNKLSLLKTLDLCSPATVLAHAFGRVGCYLNGCCYGKPTGSTWGTVYPSGSPPAFKFQDTAHAFTKMMRGTEVTLCDSLPLHPVQLIEAGGNVIIFAILFFLLGKLRKGQVAALYMFSYGCLRFFDEFLRGDHTDFIFGVLTPAQTIALVLIPVAVVAFIYFGKRNDDDASTETKNAES